MMTVESGKIYLEKYDPETGGCGRPSPWSLRELSFDSAPFAMKYVDRMKEGPK